MLRARQEECVWMWPDLCAHKSNTIMIDMLEDEVALETQKYKMPYNHSQMEQAIDTLSLHSSQAPRSAIAIIFVL